MLRVIVGGGCGNRLEKHLHRRTVWACVALLEESDPCSLSIDELGAFKVRLQDLLERTLETLAGQRFDAESYWCPTCGDTPIPLSSPRCAVCECELQEELEQEKAVPR
jgi:hypothetical protein